MGARPGKKGRRMEVDAVFSSADDVAKSFKQVLNNREI